MRLVGAMKNTWVWRRTNKLRHEEWIKNHLMCSQSYRAFCSAGALFKGKWSSPENKKGAANIVLTLKECEIFWGEKGDSYVWNSQRHIRHNYANTHICNKNGSESSGAGMMLLQQLWQNPLCWFTLPLSSSAEPFSLSKAQNSHKSLSSLREK